MKSDQTDALRPDQTEQQVRQTMLDACRQLEDFGLNNAGLLAMGHRRHRSGAQGLLTTPQTLLAPVDWQADQIRWHLTSPDPVPAEPWPGQPANAQPSPHEPWLGLYRGLLNEYGSTQVILLIAPPYATALACLPRVQSEGLPAIHPVVSAFGTGGLACAGFVATGSEQLDQQALDIVVPVLAGRPACLLANLGMLVMGESVRQVVNRAKSAEGLARLYSLSLQMGEPAVLDADQLNLCVEQWQHPV